MHPLSGYEVANKKFVVLFKLEATSNFGKINDQKLSQPIFFVAMFNFNLIYICIYVCICILDVDDDQDEGGCGK